MNIPDNVLQWLLDRGLTEKVIYDNQLSWDGNRIVIPVFDPAGNFVFNKYRRDPYSDLGPKYQYDQGSVAQLYCANKLKTNDTVIVCEGELDALRLESEGWLAVSTTGGSGTWNKDWNDLLKDKEIFICYDNDDAGLKGAVKLLAAIPGYLVILPRLKDVKDITNFLKIRTWEDFHKLLRCAKKYQRLCQEPDEVDTITKAKENLKQYREFLKDLHEEEIEIQNKGKATFQYEYLRRPLEDMIDKQEKTIKKIQADRKPQTEPVNGISAENINRAKSVSLLDLYVGKLSKSGQRRTGRCPFHEGDDTPSFNIYLNNNRFFCFGCSASGDAIEFVMKTENCDFKTAVEKLLRWK